MRRTVVSIVMLAVAALLFAETAAARSGPGAGLWLEGFGSWNTYSMTDPNRLVGLVNDELTGTGLSMDRIRDGFGLGIRAGGDLSLLTLGIGYERFFARSSIPGVIGTVQLTFPANAVLGLVEYRLPASRAAGVRLGVAGGIVSLAPVSRVLPVELTGSGPLLEGYAAAEWWTTPHVALVGAAGYRFAKVGKPESGGVRVSDFEIDYGGVQVRAGVKFALVK